VIMFTLWNVGENRSHIVACAEA